MCRVATAPEGVLVKQVPLLKKLLQQYYFQKKMSHQAHTNQNHHPLQSSITLAQFLFRVDFNLAFFPTGS
jgi:hypothetical protein